MSYSNIEALRTERNSRLQASDFYMMPDYLGNRDEFEILAVGLYRQDLRDFPANLIANEDGSYDLTDIDLPKFPFLGE
jgi:hypothetical protein